MFFSNYFTNIVFFFNLKCNWNYSVFLNYFFKKKKIRKTSTIRFERKSFFLRIFYTDTFFFYFTKITPLLDILHYSKLFQKIKFELSHNFKKSMGDGFFAIRALLLIFIIDALITDDEPIWEPIEWSLIQTWVLFIFIFAWIAENLIVSRFGSYTGRDKRVWLAWYKFFWLIELVYVVSYAAAAMFVIVPFYYELTYNLTFIFSWWSWYTKIFFFKFVSAYSLVLLLANYFILNLKWLNWKKNFFLILVILGFLSFLLYSQFIITFFSYFCDPLWYQKTRFIDFIQLSHEPLKWGWGPAKRDHFTYHKVSTVFWFKNDAPFAGAFLMFNMFFFLCLFFLSLYWIVLFRKAYTTTEITYTFSVYCVSGLKQFFFFFLLLFGLIWISFIISYWRYPLEFIWNKNSINWLNHFLHVLGDYPSFALTIIIK